MSTIYTLKENAIAVMTLMLDGTKFKDLDEEKKKELYEALKRIGFVKELLFRVDIDKF